MSRPLEEIREQQRTTWNKFSKTSTNINDRINNNIYCFLDFTLVV